ncbi:hypothetical protein ACJRO7_001520 [Eucalyptus globulus]|uniref:Uncharacterized protein n=1 Tax=Eucalyptus globulus TaxID=34317 RepID=A0ABD3LWG2_EUCGL
MAKLSFAQFFIAALVFSALCVCPHALTPPSCSEVLEQDLKDCADQPCVAQCQSKHGKDYSAAGCGKDFDRRIKCICFFFC